MGHYRIGDEIVCAFDLGDSKSSWIQEHKIQILGFKPEGELESAQMLCYVPHYVTIGRKTFDLTKKLQAEFKFHDKFLGEQGVFVLDSQVIKHIDSIPGATCKKCGLHIQFAEETMTYRCRACRENPYR